MPNRKSTALQGEVITGELADLDAREAVIEDFVAVVSLGWRECAIAVRDIRERRLYRLRGFKSFDAYLDQRWSHTRQWASRLILALDSGAATESSARVERSQQKVSPLVTLPGTDDRRPALSPPLSPIPAGLSKAEQVARSKRSGPAEPRHIPGVSYGLSARQAPASDDFNQDVEPGGPVENGPSSVSEHRDAIDRLIIDLPASEQRAAVMALHEHYELSAWGL